MGAGGSSLDPATGVSRRAFLAGAATLAVAVAVPVVAAGPALAQSNSSQLLRHNFTPQLHRSFKIIDGTGTATAVLLHQVSDLVPEPSPGNDLRFSLVFAGGTAGALRQGTYQVVHPSIGSFELLVVPVGLPDLRTPSQTLYQVIVNRG